MFNGKQTAVATGEVRLSYANLVTPRVNQSRPNDPAKYSVTLLIPKTDTATKADIDSAIKAAYEEGVQTKWKNARPQLSKALIYDGDGNRADGTPYGPECRGHWVIAANSLNKPGVMDIGSGLPVDPDHIYSGMYARVTLNFYPFAASGNRGVACGLNNVFKTRDGEKLSGGPSAESELALLMGQGAPVTATNADIANLFG